MLPRILFLAHRVPYPPDKGDRIRSYHLLRHLAARARIHLGFLTEGDVPAATRRVLDALCEHIFVGRIPQHARIRQGCVNLLIGKSITEAWFYSATFQAEVDRLLAANEYDAVFCYSSSTLQYVLGRGLEDQLITDLIDVDSEKWLDYSRRGGPLMSHIYHIEGQRVREIEKRAATSQVVLLTTEREAALYRKHSPQANVQVVNNGIDLDYFTPQAGDEQQGCIFVGYLDYRANVVGLQWYCQEIWPHLYKMHPRATFRIVGRNPTRAVRALGRLPGVDVVGPVADIRPLISQTSVVVVPLPIARGIQNKILEAMALGKAVVSSQTALAGISARVGRDIIGADTPDEWITKIDMLWKDADRRREIGTHARRFVESRHDWQHCLAPLTDIFDRVRRLRRLPLVEHSGLLTASQTCPR